MQRWLTLYRTAIGLFIALLSYLAVQTYESVGSLKEWAATVNERGNANRTDIKDLKADVKNINAEISDIRESVAGIARSHR